MNPNDAGPKDIFEVEQEGDIQTLVLKGDDPKDLIELHQTEVDEMVRHVVDAATDTQTKRILKVLRHDKPVVLVVVKPKKLLRMNAHPVIIMLKTDRGVDVFQFNSREAFEFADLFSSPPNEP
jgi:hypothetical protein